MESKLKTLCLNKEQDVSSNVYIVEKGEYSKKKVLLKKEEISYNDLHKVLSYKNQLSGFVA